MKKLHSKEWQDFLNNALAVLVAQQPIAYNLLTPARIPSNGGVYLVTEIVADEEVALYVGKSGNLSERIYRNHLMGNERSSNLKRYLIGDPTRLQITDANAAKLFLSTSCRVRWILESQERKRGAVECFCIAKLYPMYGITTEEH